MYILTPLLAQRPPHSSMALPDLLSTSTNLFAVSKWLVFPTFKMRPECRTLATSWKQWFNSRIGKAFVFNSGFLFLIFCKFDVCLIDWTPCKHAASFPWNYFNHCRDRCKITWRWLENKNNTVHSDLTIQVDRISIPSIRFILFLSAELHLSFT